MMSELFGMVLMGYILFLVFLMFIEIIGFLISGYEVFMVGVVFTWLLGIFIGILVFSGWIFIAKFLI